MRLTLIALLWLARPIYAAEIPCGAVEANVIQLDGMLDDWNDVAGVDAGGRDANLSFTVKCNRSLQSLFLAIDVRDDYLARTAQSRPGEDHIELYLGGRKLLVYPGDAAQLKDRVSWGKKPARNLRSFGARQAAGWAVELELPLAEIGVKLATPRLPFSARVADCDSKARLTTDRSAEVAGALTFGEGESALDAFLRGQRLSRGAIWFDKMMATGRGDRARVLLAGKYMVVVSDGYIYQELPFRDRKDLREARLIDLAGDGREALVLRYRDHAGERLAAYRPDGPDKVARIFNQELSGKVSFVPRGHATDVVLEGGTEKKARYRFSGDEYHQVP